MSTALALYEHANVKLSGQQLSALEKTVIAQVSFFQRNQPETSTRIILSGLAMRRIRVSLGHGNWEPWIKRNIVPILGAAAGRTIRNWMRLADKFAEETELTLPDFLALPGDQGELALVADKDATARRLMKSVENFVGELGPTELMIEHDIREDAGAARKRKLLNKGAKPATAEEKEQTVQERFNEIETALQLARKGATDKGTWMSFSKKHHDALKSIFNHAAEQVGEIYAKTHGNRTKP